MEEKENGLKNMYGIIEMLQGQVEFLETNPFEEAHLSKGMAEYCIKGYEDIVEAIEKGRPMVGGHPHVLPEISISMGLVPVNIYASSILLQSHGGDEEWTKAIEEAENMGVPTSICSALRATAYIIETGLSPTPDVLISTTHYCDSLPTVFEIVNNHKKWGKIPMFLFDAPYILDARGLDYIATEVERFVLFLEEHTSRRLDVDRLRDVIEESNKQFLLWHEWQELRRAVPCPHSSVMLAAPFVMAQLTGAGNPTATDWFRELVVHAEEQVKAKKGHLEDEKVRYMWCDCQGSWTQQMFTRLEQEYNAICIMDFSADCQYMPIDTSSKESMFRGLGYRLTHHVPMHGMWSGPVDRYLDRMVRVAKDHKVECALYPAHVGHKEFGAATGIFRDAFREIGIPFLALDCDIWDSRQNSVDSIVNRVGTFFSTIDKG